MSKISRRRERQFLVSESDLKRFKVFYQIPKDELVGWTMNTVAVGYAMQLAGRQLNQQEVETFCDDIMENGVFCGLNDRGADYIREYVSSNLRKK